MWPESMEIVDPAVLENELHSYRGWDCSHRKELFLFCRKDSEFPLGEIHYRESQKYLVLSSGLNSHVD